MLIAALWFFGIYPRRIELRGFVIVLERTSGGPRHSSLGTFIIIIIFLLGLAAAAIGLTRAAIRDVIAVQEVLRDSRAEIEDLVTLFPCLRQSSQRLRNSSR